VYTPRVRAFVDRKEGCTMAASVLAVPPHPSGIGR
jgi:hypothetical protein